jgi:hypothetical protein
MSTIASRSILKPSPLIPTPWFTEPGWWKQSFEEYQEQHHFELTWPPGASEEEIKKQFAERQRRYIAEHTPHPNRAEPYYMNIHPTMAQGSNKFTAGKNWSMLELIRNVSNVSTQFQKEFGDVFRGRTRVTM